MTQPDSATLHQSSSPRLARSLSAPETWAFGLTSHVGWVAIVPAIHAALGPQAMFVWIPAVILGMLLNYQVKHLGMHLVDVAGGTPNYITKLWQRYPGIGRYAAIGYFLSWVANVPVYSVVLSDLIEVNLEALGITCPSVILKIGFTFLPFAVAFSGTRALSILHLFFAIPALVVLLIFCLQGLGFLAFSPDSPGLFPSSWSSISFVDWAKWFYYVTYQTYSCETASSFVADSRRPTHTLRFLDIAAVLMPPVFVGGSWIIMRLATASSLKDDAFLTLVAGSSPFWGKLAQFIVTFLLAGSCLLNLATTLSNCPRILYQLAIDKHLSTVFSVVSRRGVFGPSLTLILVLCLFYLIWGNVTSIIIVSNLGWFVSIMILHLGLWLGRDRPLVLFPRLSLGIFVLEVVVLLVGGCAWGWQDFLIGLVSPIAIVTVDALMRRIRFAPFRSRWWMRRVTSRMPTKIEDSVMLQVIVLIFLLCCAVLVGWLFGVQLNKPHVTVGENLVVVLLMTVAFVGVAIACWTTLPQVIAIAEAREAAQQSEAQLWEKSQQLAVQLVQSEKMSSLGQLVAGVAHEINNPVSFIDGNLTYADAYTQDLLRLLQLYQQYYPNPAPEIQAEANAIELDFLIEDLPKLLTSMRIGADRITQIVLSLRNFSRLDEADMKAVNIHEGIDSTLMILENRLKARPNRPEILVIKEYGNLPRVECYAGQLNQVFMNILTNAIDAIEEGMGHREWGMEITPNAHCPLPIAHCPTIRIITELTDARQVIIRISDNGLGIPESVQQRLFDPFFTTKPVGKGTGLGLSISYQIITVKHGGKLQCISSPGEGAEFLITIPLHQQQLPIRFG